MRLLRFVNEAYKEVADNEEEIIKILRRDCKKYISLMKKPYTLLPFKRGMKMDIPKSTADFALYSKKTRKIRMPKGGMFADSYDIINEWLVDNGHFSRMRDVLIASSRTTGLFGDQFFVFPIKMKGFTYVKAGDFNFGSNNWYAIGVSNIVDDMASAGYDEDEIRQKLIEFLDENFRDAFVTNKNILDAYMSGYEIWFNCREYYFIDTYYKNKVESIMREI